MKRLFPFGLALLALLLWAVVGLAQSATPITVSGQVTNGTADAAPPADLPVTLHRFAGVESLGIYTTTLAADGSFRFEPISPAEGETLLAETIYQDVAYFSEALAFQGGDISLPITVFETTEDRSALVVTQMHVFINVQGDALQIGEYYLVSNNSDRTYIGQVSQDGQRITLTFALPSGADNLQFNGPGLGERFVALTPSNERFADTYPVVPGEATGRIMFSYNVPYRAGIVLERLIDLPVASAVLLVTDPGLALTGQGITPSDPVDTQMGQAQSYTAGPLAAGQPLRFTLNGQPTSNATSTTAQAPDRRPVTEAAIGGGALLLACLAAYWLWGASGSATMPEKARPLVQAIAALDAEREAGRLPAQSYERQRETLKRQLRKLLSTDD